MRIPQALCTYLGTPYLLSGKAPEGKYLSRLAVPLPFPGNQMPGMWGHRHNPKTACTGDFILALLPDF